MIPRLRITILKTGKKLELSSTHKPPPAGSQASSHTYYNFFAFCVVYHSVHDNIYAVCT